MSSFLDKLAVYDKKAVREEPLTPKKELFFAKDIEIVYTVFWDSFSALTSLQKSDKEV